MVNIGVVGLSEQGVQHIEAVREHPNFNLVGVCDRNRIILDEIARRFDCDLFDNIGSMLESASVDALILCLPHHEYGPVLDIAFSHKVHILKEKPLARSIEEAQTFLTKARESGSELGVAAQRRFHKPYKLAKEILTLIGTPRWISIMRCDNKSSRTSAWRYSKKLAGGGALLDIGYHVVDIASWYFGKPEQIHCSIMQPAPLKVGSWDGVEETALVVMELPKNATCQVLVSRQSSPKSEQLIINGSRGHIHVSRTALELFSSDGILLDQQTFDASWANSMTSQLDDFYRLLAGEKDCLTDAKSHLAPLEIVQAIYVRGIQS